MVQEKMVTVLLETGVCVTNSRCPKIAGKNQGSNDSAATFEFWSRGAVLSDNHWKSPADAAILRQIPAQMIRSVNLHCTPANSSILRQMQAVSGRCRHSPAHTEWHKWRHMPETADICWSLP